MPTRDSSGGGRLRILVVEDESLLALTMVDMLSDFGHDVIGPAGQLSKALELARKAALDLAILDVNLNGVDSYPVADALAARGIPFVLTTGYEAARLPKRYAGGPILQKPFHEDDLRTTIAGLR